MKVAHDKCMGHTRSSSSAFIYMMSLFQRYQERVQMQQQQIYMQRYAPQYQGFHMFGSEQKRPVVPVDYDAHQYYSNRFAPPRRHDYYPQPYYPQEMMFRGKRAAEDAPTEKPQAPAAKKPEETPKPAAPTTVEPATEAPVTSMPEKMIAQLEAVPLPIRQMFEQLQHHVSNMTCIMKELGFIGDDNKPLYDMLKTKIDAMQIPNEIREDLYSGVEYCRKVSTCLPIEETSSMMVELAQPMTFFKCFKGKKLEACMKKDLRERFGQFFDDELMTMSRHFMGEDEKRPFGNRDNMFDMLYGFDVKEMKYFL